MKITWLNKVLALIACGLIIAFILALWPARIRLQTLKSPDEKHEVELLRTDFIDRNYSVYVDGRRVYVSPDFAPRRDISFREALTWDKTGRIAILEVARHRIFGYDLKSRERLTDERLLAVELAPDPSLWEYYFESEWPGIGRVSRSDMPPEAD